MTEPTPYPGQAAASGTIRSSGPLPFRLSPSSPPSFLAGQFFENTQTNLRRLGIASGFGFLSSPSGFDILQSLIPYSATSSYGAVFWVALLNTLLVSILGYRSGHPARVLYRDRPPVEKLADFPAGAGLHRNSSAIFRCCCKSSSGISPCCGPCPDRARA
jgi:hypothetical protein